MVTPAATIYDPSQALDTMFNSRLSPYGFRHVSNNKAYTSGNDFFGCNFVPSKDFEKNWTDSSTISSGNLRPHNSNRYIMGKALAYCKVLDADLNNDTTAPSTNKITKSACALSAHASKFLWDTKNNAGKNVLEIATWHPSLADPEKMVLSENCQRLDKSSGYELSRFKNEYKKYHNTDWIDEFILSQSDLRLTPTSSTTPQTII